MAPPKGKADKAPLDFETGEIVLGKVRGYPPWPGKIIAEDTVPADVMAEKPKARVVHCVLFFPKGDHSWQTPKEMKKLHKHNIEAFVNEPSKKNGELLTAYKIALDPAEWLDQREKDLAAAAEAAKNAQIDELDEDEEDEEDGTGTKKRKRADDKKKPTKKSAAPKSSEAGSKPKKKVKKNGLSAAMIPESEDEAANGDAKDRPAKRAKGDDEDDEEDTLSPEAKRVKGWRHDLQRTFLPKTGNIKAEDMAGANETLKTIEEFGDKMTVGLLTSSKIGKVIKKITQLKESEIPNSDEFNIAERSKKLMAQWNNKAGQTNGTPAPTKNGPVSTDNAKPAESPAPAAEENKMDVDKAETTAPAAPADGDVVMNDHTAAPTTA